MGTRADFYIGRGEQAEWLGSTAFDGYPEGVAQFVDDKGMATRGEPQNSPILTAAEEKKYRDAVASFLAADDYSTTPDQGWPWPWEDSRTTDYSYAFEDGKVWACCFGHRWFDPLQPEPEDDDPAKECLFPNMKERQKVTLGGRSGLMVIGTEGPIDDLP